MKIQNSQANLVAEQILPQTVPLTSATPFQARVSSRTSEKPEAPNSNSVSIQVDEGRVMESVLDSQKIVVDLQNFSNVK